MTPGGGFFKIEKMLKLRRKTVDTGSRERAYYDSPIGTIEIIGNSRGLSELRFLERPPAPVASTPRSLRAAIGQVDEYFRGARKAFHLRLLLRGSPFQTTVWRRVAKIPFGQTMSYGEIAAAIGRPGAARAVGAANRTNPVAIIVPCHRVIGANGRLVGYGGGLWRKEWLLRHEGKSLSSRQGIPCRQGQGRQKEKDNDT